MVVCSNAEPKLLKKKNTSIVMSHDQCLFYKRIFSKFQPEIMNFDLYKGFFKLYI